MMFYDIRNRFDSTPKCDERTDRISIAISRVNYADARENDTDILQMPKNIMIRATVRAGIITRSSADADKPARRI